MLRNIVAFLGFYFSFCAAPRDRKVSHKLEIVAAPRMRGCTQEDFALSFGSCLRRKARRAVMSNTANEAIDPAVFTPACRALCHSVAAAHSSINCARLS